MDIIIYNYNTINNMNDNLLAAIGFFSMAAPCLIFITYKVCCDRKDEERKKRLRVYTERHEHPDV